MNYKERQRAVTLYCRDRLVRETKDKPFGTVTRVARASKIRGPTLSNIISGKALVGSDVAGRLATYWGMKPAQLEAEATGQRVDVGTSVLERARVELLADGALPETTVEQIRTMEFSGLETQLVEAAKRVMLALVFVPKTLPERSGGEDELEAEVIDARRPGNRKRLKA